LLFSRVSLNDGASLSFFFLISHHKCVIVLERAWPVFFCTGFGMGIGYMECKYGFVYDPLVYRKKAPRSTEKLKDNIMPASTTEESSKKG
jgi:hypothetical protein